MSTPQIEVTGTLQADGTLVLNEKPSLPPGPVTVVLRQKSPPPMPPQENWFDFMMRTRRELEAAGSHFMNEQEVQEHIEWLREGDYVDDLLREADARR